MVNLTESVSAKGTRYPGYEISHYIYTYICYFVILLFCGEKLIIHTYMFYGENMGETDTKEREESAGFFSKPWCF